MHSFHPVYGLGGRYNEARLVGTVADALEFIAIQIKPFRIIAFIYKKNTHWNCICRVCVIVSVIVFVCLYGMSVVIYMLCEHLRLT